MNKINFKVEPFSYSNPYHEPKEKKPHWNQKIFILTDSWTNLTNRIVHWGEKHLFRDFEQETDFAGKATKILDNGVVAVVGTMEGVVLTHHLFHFKMGKLPVLRSFPTLLKIITLPIKTLFLGFSIVEGITEGINLHRVKKFLSRLEALKRNPLAQFEWIKREYFTLTEKEERKIQEYIEKAIPMFSSEQKEVQFDRIAEKVLKIKFQRLKRRITSKLAKEMVKEMPQIIQNLESTIPRIQVNGEKRAEILLSSLTRQAKNKILVHTLGMIAIGISLLSLSLFLAGIPAGFFFTLMGILSFLIVACCFAIDKGIIEREGEKLYDALDHFNLHVKEILAPSPSSVVNL